MAYVAIADRDAPIHHPHSFIERYIWSQDHKVIAIQYAIVAISIVVPVIGPRRNRHEALAPRVASSAPASYRSSPQRSLQLRS